MHACAHRTPEYRGEVRCAEFCRRLAKAVCHASQTCPPWTPLRKLCQAVAKLLHTGCSDVVADLELIWGRAVIDMS